MKPDLRNRRLFIGRRTLLGAASGAALLGVWPRFDSALAAVEPQRAGEERDCGKGMMGVG
jgi:hypothetical protein